jgi:hypothetical protein
MFNNNNTKTVLRVMSIAIKFVGNLARICGFSYSGINPTPRKKPPAFADG